MKAQFFKPGRILLSAENYHERIMLKALVRGGMPDSDEVIKVYVTRHGGWAGDPGCDSVLIAVEKEDRQ